MCKLRKASSSLMDQPGGFTLAASQSTVVLNGTANEVYCSGYTEYANAKATVGSANMLVYGWYGVYGLSRGQGEAFLLNSSGCY
jgi:hypothetical protein